MTLKASGKKVLTSLLLVIISGAVLPALSQEKNFQPNQRPLTAADLSRFEQIGDHNIPFSFSADGKYLAFVVVRAEAAAAQMGQHSVFDEDRSDIWLAPVSGGRPRNITNGARDGTGYFMPVWSPDGSRLAMISTKGGGFRLWVWDKASEQTRVLTEENINYWFSDERSIVWVSNEQLVCAVLPKGKRPGAIEQRKLSAETAMRGWPKAWRGQEPTASVIESGVPVKFANRPQGQLLLLDAVTGKKKVIASGTFRAIKLSPDKQHFAVLKQTSVFRPDPDRSFASRSFRRFAVLGYQVIIANSGGEIVAPELGQVDNVYTVEWAGNSGELAIVGEQPGNGDSNFNTFVYKLATRSVRRAIMNTADPPGLMWSKRIQLLVRAGQQNNDKKQTEVNRTDWWLTSANEVPRNLTAEMKSVPSAIFDGPLETFVGVAGGDLWEIRANGTTPKKISLGMDDHIRSISGPGRSTTEPGKLSSLVVETGNGSLTRYYLMDLTSHSMVEIAKPDAVARLVDFNFKSNSGAMIANTRNGTYLWLVQPQEAKPLLIRETNTFLKDIAEGERKLIEYRSVEGRLLKGWVILPVNYQEGKKYPLVTWVYPGTIYGDLTSERGINYPLALNLQLLSGHGYAVLLPSIPIDPPGQVKEAYMQIANGTLPAVAKTIEMGIADPTRLAVMGHSYGGYATLCLITQTNKFRAAIALAGPTDYASYYGEFLLAKRYTETPLEFPARMYDLEGTSSINLGLGNPPWKNMQLYLRNSPLSYVEKVETPVMIIHGDMDIAVPIEQSEQLFSALYRRNRRARFVRYWGEGHMIDSPANIRDMWERIYGWLDELLIPTGQ
jgi:dipeptidyl aminopeptidase/acylaminoacyl peptidase